MSDIGEPPSKVTKSEEELDEEYLDEEHLDDESHQEEWLSEEMLTDNEFKNESADEKKNSKLTTAIKKVANSQINEKLEKTLNDLDKTEIKEEAEKLVEIKKDDDLTDAETDKNSDDGNDTDDLLRMLEDDGKSKKVKDLKPKIGRATADDPMSSDNENLTISNAKLTRLRVAKSVLPKNQGPKKVTPKVTTKNEPKAKPPPPKSKNVASKTSPMAKRALPEVSDSDEMEKPDIKTRGKLKLMQKKATYDTSESDEYTSEEETQVKRPVKMKKKLNVAAKSTSKSALPVQKQPMKKFEEKSQKKGSDSSKSAPQKTAPKQVIVEKKELEEIINEEDFLEDEDIDLDENFTDSDIDMSIKAEELALMKPETMDEEEMSDLDSFSDEDEDSIYDDLPSSDSEEVDDWFTLDLRTESASEYLPLLGAKAKKILIEEKEKVEGRLKEIKKSLATLANSAKLQTRDIKEATATLNKLDTLLKAT